MFSVSFILTYGNACLNESACPIERCFRGGHVLQEDMSYGRTCLTGGCVFYYFFFK